MKYLKILISLVFASVLVIPNSILVSAENLEEVEEVKEVKSNSSMIINSLESGEAIGERFFETITTSFYNDNNELTEILMKTKTTTVIWDTGKEIESYNENIFTFHNNSLTSINGEATSDEQFKEEFLKFSNDEVSTLSHSGGVSGITHYYSTNRGGYFLKSAQMKGLIAGGTNSLMLDTGAVVPNSMITKHNYLASDQGGLVSTFQVRADAVNTAQKLLITEAAFLAGAGIALLTPAFWAGVAAGVGSAATMILTHNSAMSDIEANYENIQAIRNQ